MVRWNRSIHIPNLNLPSLAEYFTSRMRLELKVMNMAPSRNVYIADEALNMGWPQLLSIPLFFNSLKENNKFVSNHAGRLSIIQVPLICEEQKRNFFRCLAMARPKPKVEEYKRTRGKEMKVNFIKSLIGGGNSLDGKDKSQVRSAVL